MAVLCLWEGFVLKVVMKKGKKYWYWKLVAKNGETLAHSESYSSKPKCFKTAKMVADKFRLTLEGGVKMPKHLLYGGWGRG